MSKLCGGKGEIPLSPLVGRSFLDELLDAESEIRRGYCFYIERYEDQGLQLLKELEQTKSREQERVLKRLARELGVNVRWSSDLQRYIIFE